MDWRMQSYPHQIQTVQLHPSHQVISSILPSRMNLTGTWQCNDGGEYYITHFTSLNWVYWAGLSQQGVGDDFANVFRGHLSSTGVITGNWTDVPYGRANSLGTITLQVADNGRRLIATQQTGGFGGTIWTKKR